jgi:DNA invertase Pin-like site-specific DNA recombinase
VGLKILTGEGAAVDTTHAQGRMIFGILAVMAEFEREMISERTVAGMKAAKRRGVSMSGVRPSCRNISAGKRSRC